MRTVAANVQQLIGWNRSMAVALEKAENGSRAEDMYFIEKLEKTAKALGFVLYTPPLEDTTFGQPFAVDDGVLSEADEDETP